MTQWNDPWQTLPRGFLKMKFNGWLRLDPEVRLLVARLAKEQNYRCAFCAQTYDLIVEHDHDPERGDGDPPTIYNIRGLACHSCNWHLGMYEKEARGEFTGWDNFSISISRREYDDYIDAYDWRLIVLYEEEVKARCPNYWWRETVLYKFDRWNEGRGDYPFGDWCFDEIKEKRHGKVRTPGQFIKYTTAFFKALAAEFEKDPDYQPPDWAVRFLVKIKPFMDQMRPVVEAKMKERGLLPRKQADGEATLDTTQKREALIQDLQATLKLSKELAHFTFRLLFVAIGWAPSPNA